MLTTPIDIFRSARLLIDQHGEDATIHAAMRADEMLDEGDFDGRVVWLKVIEAINELQKTEPTGPIH